MESAVKAFNADPATRRLMEKIYGKPQLSSVPVPKTAPLGPRPAFERPMWSAGSRDPREATVDSDAVRDAEARRPRPVAPAAPVEHAVDAIPKRRGRAAINKMSAAECENAQPPLSKGRNADAEKRRLQALFTFKGGKVTCSSSLFSLNHFFTPSPLLVFLGAPGARPL